MVDYGRCAEKIESTFSAPLSSFFFFLSSVGDWGTAFRMGGSSPRTLGLELSSFGDTPDSLGEVIEMADCLDLRDGATVDEDRFKAPLSIEVKVCCLLESLVREENEVGGVFFLFRKVSCLRSLLCFPCTLFRMGGSPPRTPGLVYSSFGEKSDSLGEVIEMADCLDLRDGDAVATTEDRFKAPLPIEFERVKAGEVFKTFLFRKDSSVRPLLCFSAAFPTGCHGAKVDRDRFAARSVWLRGAYEYVRSAEIET